MAPRASIVHLSGVSLGLGTCSLQIIPYISGLCDPFSYVGPKFKEILLQLVYPHECSCGNGKVTGSRQQNCPKYRVLLAYTFLPSFDSAIHCIAPSCANIYSRRRVKGRKLNARNPIPSTNSWGLRCHILFFCGLKLLILT